MGLQSFSGHPRAHRDVSGGLKGVSWRFLEVALTDVLEGPRGLKVVAEAFQGSSGPF